jgi:transcription antitermination factor NusG
MPILKYQTDLHPESLLDVAEVSATNHWWLVYTRSRREKDLMRRLFAANVPYYGPTYRRGQRSPNGRIRLVQTPLFPNYVFLFGDEDSRRAALETNCVARIDRIAQGPEFIEELRSLKRVLSGDRPVTPELRLEPGEHVAIRSGPFRGLTGTLVNREKTNRLVVSVNFIQRGASVEVFDFEIEAA